MKKVLILSTLGVISTAALAGGVSAPTMYNTAPTTVAKNTDTGIYIEGLAGYNRHATKDIDGNLPVAPVGGYGPSLSSDWSHGQGSWALGADTGYQFNKNMAVELGGIYNISKATYTSTATFTPFNGQKTSANATRTYEQPWYAYLAGKLSIPVYDNFSIFTKLGLGYQHLKVTDTIDNQSTGDSTESSASESNVGPMFGAGIAYNFTSSMYVTGEWLRFTGKTKAIGSDDQSFIPAPNIFLVGVGYKFAM